MGRKMWWCMNETFGPICESGEVTFLQNKRPVGLFSSPRSTFPPSSPPAPVYTSSSITSTTTAMAIYTGALQPKKKSELQDLATELGLDTAGTKDDIAERIKTHLADNQILAQDERFAGLYGRRKKTFKCVILNCDLVWSLILVQGVFAAT